MKKTGYVLIAALALAGCTPADEQYCQSFGVGGTAEFAKCMSYYHQQTAMFGADRAQCELQADQIYPPTLYDYGHSEEIPPTFSRGVMYGGATVFIPPDARHNMQVDALRMRIVEPCMQEKGWNSGQSWQAGTHPVSRVKAPPVNTKLPWLK